jgi:hypothetical protein
MAVYPKIAAAWTPERRAAQRERMNQARAKKLQKRGVAPLQQQKFVQNYVRTGDATQSYRDVYGDKGPNTRSLAWNILHKPAVQKMIQDADTAIALAAQGSVDKLVELREGEDGKVALLAAKGLLDTYGDMMRRNEKKMEPGSSTNNILITGMTDDQLIARIAALGAPGVVPGVNEATVQEEPYAADGGGAGLQGPGTHAQGPAGLSAEG